MLRVKFSNYLPTLWSDENGMILAKRVISTPTIKTAYVNVPGGNGTLDYTDYFGEPMYEDRTITMTFLHFERYFDMHLPFYTDVVNNLHGQKCQLVFEDDNPSDADEDEKPWWYWDARLSVGPMQYDRDALKFDVVATCPPYKLRTQETTRSATVASGANTDITLYAGRKTVIPRITTGGKSFTVSFTLDETQHSVVLAATSAEQTIDDLILRAGATTVNVANNATSSGTITFKWRDGSL